MPNNSGWRVFNTNHLRAKYIRTKFQIYFNQDNTILPFVMYPSHNNFDISQFYNHTRSTKFIIRRRILIFILPNPCDIFQPNLKIYFSQILELYFSQILEYYFDICDDNISNVVISNRHKRIINISKYNFPLW
jgi:hypothetical protein